jgi:glycosyltransferase involved in cell wall biosynthesis
MAAPELFIAIPTWNSALFLEPCLRQIEATCKNVSYEVGVLDNGSTDATVAIARAHGCKVKIHPYALPDALNQLAWWSRSPYTLFIHSDTMLLNPQWFALCKAHLVDAVALVSPQDIGCGPFTRPKGKDKPESSFMLFRTRDIDRMRIVRWVRRFRLRLPQRIVNFYSPSVTHYLPSELARIGCTWYPMKVHTSRHLDAPVYTPRTDARCWADELGYLEYGLGNFYSVDGVITHYHNWYERQLDNEQAMKKIDPLEIPLDYIGQRSRQFLDDLASGAVSWPDPHEPEREPKALPVREAAQPG